MVRFSHDICDVIFNTFYLEALEAEKMEATRIKKERYEARRTRKIVHDSDEEENDGDEEHDGPDTEIQACFSFSVGHPYTDTVVVYIPHCHLKTKGHQRGGACSTQ